MSLKYRTSAGTSASNFSDLVVKVGDTLPIGTEVDYDGQSVPAGWQEVDDPNVYSTTETRIGTWIDGKPLYRRIFIVNAKVPTNTASSGGSVTLLNLATYNINEFFIDFNRLDNADKTVSYYNPFSSGTPRYFAISKVAGNVLANFYNAFSNEDVIITFSALYTKTTD